MLLKYLYLYIISFLLVSVILTSCESECPVCSPCVQEDNVSIYAILDASSPFQRAIAARIMDNQYAGEIFINDLDFRLNGSILDSRPNTTTFLERRYFDYEEDANYLGQVNVADIDSVRVQVFREGRLLAQGSTNIPDSFIVNLDTSSQVLSWTRNLTDQSTGGTFMYEDTDLLRMYSVSAYKRIGAGEYETLLENDYVFDNSYVLNDSLFFLRGFYRYIVTAYDLNFYNFSVLDSTSEGLELGTGLVASKRSIKHDHFPPR